MSFTDATDRFYRELWPHRAAVLRVARILTHGDADADDLAQDAMMRAYRGIDGLAPGSNAKAWLMTILRNTHTDHLRSRRGGETSLDTLDVDPPDQHSGDDVAAWGDARETLAEFSDEHMIRALKALPREICWT